MSFCSLTSCSIRERGYTSVMSSLEIGRGREGGMWMIGIEEGGKKGGRDGRSKGGNEERKQYGERVK